jgi:integrase
MQDDNNPIPAAPKRTAWNKGKLIGAKPPLRPKHVWSIRTKLQIEGRTRDLAMFNLAIDSKLRGCDVVALKVDDIAPHGYAVDRATVRQKKTGIPVRFEITEQTRQAVDDYLRTIRQDQHADGPFRSSYQAGGRPGADPRRDLHQESGRRNASPHRKAPGTAVVDGPPNHPIRMDNDCA